MEKLAFIGIMACFSDIYCKNLNKMSYKSSKHRFDNRKNVVNICFSLVLFSVFAPHF